MRIFFVTVMVALFMCAVTKADDASQHLKPGKIEQFREVSQSILAADSAKKQDTTAKQICALILDIDNTLNSGSENGDNQSTLKGNLIALEDAIKYKIAEIQAAQPNNHIDSNALVKKLSGIVVEIDDILNNADSVDMEKVSSLIGRIKPTRKPFISDGKGLSGNVTMRVKQTGE